MPRPHLLFHFNSMQILTLSCKYRTLSHSISCITLNAGNGSRQRPMVADRFLHPGSPKSPRCILLCSPRVFRAAQVRSDSAAIRQMLGEAQAQAGSPPPLARSSTLSTLTHAYDCGGNRHEVETRIEPLVAALRPPGDFCLHNGFTSDLGYIALQHSSAFQGRDAGVKNILFDLGASNWGGGQNWCGSTPHPATHLSVASAAFRSVSEVMPLPLGVWPAQLTYFICCVRLCCQSTIIFC